MVCQLSVRLEFFSFPRRSLMNFLKYFSRLGSYFNFFLYLLSQNYGSQLFCQQCNALFFVVFSKCFVRYRKALFSKHGAVRGEASFFIAYEVSHCQCAQRRKSMTVSKVFFRENSSKVLMKMRFPNSEPSTAAMYGVTDKDVPSIAWSISKPLQFHNWMTQCCCFGWERSHRQPSV